MSLVSIIYSPCRRNICQGNGILREIKLSFNFYNILFCRDYRKSCSKITDNVIFRHFKSKLTKVGIWIQAGATSACHMHQISSHLTIYSKFHHITFNGSIFCNFPLISAKASKYISRNHFQHWNFWAHHVGQIFSRFSSAVAILGKQLSWKKEFSVEYYFSGISLFFSSFLNLVKKITENIIWKENKTDWS